MGMCPEPRQLHKEASLICKEIVEELCKRGTGFILVQRFEKIEDAERIINLSEKYGYKWNIYSITPDYVDIARNNIKRARSLLNINTFSPSSLQRSITKYTETASYFYRLAALPSILSMCDVRQQTHGVFSETYYKKDGNNVYVDNNPSIHSPLLSSRDSKEIEDYALFADIDMHRYENFFYRDDDNGAAFKAASLRVLRAVSRSANGTIEIANKDGHTSEMLSNFYRTHQPDRLLHELVAFVYNKRFLSIKDANDLENFILEVARRTTGLTNEKLFRTHETGKYLATHDVREHFDRFVVNLFDKMKSERNRIYVASYILWSMDFIGHYFADGCTRTSTLIALWYLMRTGNELPIMERRLDSESDTRSSYRGRHHMSRDDIYDDEVRGQKFNQFYRYYKSLFEKSARPTIPCAGGYIFNQKGEILLLRSSKGKDIGKYVAPGGKMNREETAEECFIRETQEETGISIGNITLLGKRRYTAPSGRRYLMYDFTAQAVTTSVEINHESMASEWTAPINIEPSECTTSTLDGLDKYLHINEIIKGTSDGRLSRFEPLGDQLHATGALEKAYIEKKMSNYLWALKARPKKVVIHGTLPFQVAISSLLPHGENIDGKSGYVAKDRNSNALRPSSVLDADSQTLHLFNFPGDDILRHYALLFSKHLGSAPCEINIVRYPEIDKNLFRLTGLTNQIVHSRDIVYLGYSTRLKEYLLAKSVELISMVESFWYISSRFRVGESVLNVLECKYGHWGDISADLSQELCKLGAKAIIHNGKVGTFVSQSEVYSRVYIPNRFTIYHPQENKVFTVPIDNDLSSFIPFQSGIHISCSTPLDETSQFLDIAKNRYTETVDIESSKIAEAIMNYSSEYDRDVKFGAIHYASDFVGPPDDTFTSYNLSNEHDRNPQAWKDAVLQDIFNVIIYSIENPLPNADT